ncbi:MAG: hypothetical protein U0271_17035 [Polyangiaceae bacterium]
MPLRDKRIERRRGLRRVLAVSSALVGLSALVPDAFADEPHAAPAAVEEQPRIIRLALSKRAAEKLSDLRVRRLVELQLGGEIVVPVEATGPLDENAVRVFIDLPQPTRATVQVQALDRPLESREVDVAGMSWEVATRYIALAVSEVVRGQIAPKRRPRPRTPTSFEEAAALARIPRVQFGAALEAAYVEDFDTLLLGSRVFAGFHQQIFSEQLSFAAMGTIDGRAYLEGDIVLEHRFWVLPPLRINLGAGFGIAGLERPQATGDFAFDLWARVHAELAVELQLDEKAWLAIGASPGFTIDPQRQLIGGWLGGSVRMSFEGT